MTSFRIIEAKPWHCGQMVRLLHAERHAFTLNLGVSEAHRHLRVCFDNSSFRRAWMIDDQIAVVGGVVGSMMSADGYLWLCVSELARRHRVAFVKEAHAQLKQVLHTFRRLVITIVDDDNSEERRDIRFAIFMGFNISREKIDVMGEARAAHTFRYQHSRAA